MRYTAAQTKTSPQELKNGFSKLSKYITQLQTIAKDKSYEHAESSINLPFEEKIPSRVKITGKKICDVLSKIYSSCRHRRIKFRNKGYI